MASFAMLLPVFVLNLFWIQILEESLNGTPFEQLGRYLQNGLRRMATGPKYTCNIQMTSATLLYERKMCSIVVL